MAISTYKTFLMIGSFTYALTEDSTITLGKTYYTRSGSEGSYVYTAVDSPVVSAIGTYYERSVGSTYNKFLDIKDFPDLGGSPNQLDTTTLSDGMNTFINGIVKTDSFEFTANYTKANYNACKNIEDVEYPWAVWFGGTGSGSQVTPSGTDGKFKFCGKLTAYPVGGGVDEVVDMKLAIGRTTVVDFE